MDEIFRTAAFAPICITPAPYAAAAHWKSAAPTTNSSPARQSSRSTAGRNTDTARQPPAVCPAPYRKTQRSGAAGEDRGEVTSSLRRTPSLRLTFAFARKHIASNPSMLGAGAVPGPHALASVMDELAIALKMGRIELRLRDEPAVDAANTIRYRRPGGGSGRRTPCRRQTRWRATGACRGPAAVRRRLTARARLNADHATAPVEAYPAKRGGLSLPAIASRYG